MLDGVQQSPLHRHNQLLAEVKASTINGCWYNLWPQVVRNFTDFPDNTERHETVGFARQVGGEGFDDMEPEELDNLITSHADEELDVITKVSKEEEEVGSDEEEVSSSWVRCYRTCGQ